ncbi:MAG: heme/hemin ABC transporter substrate-binding protein [Thermomicrobiales bacterium]
MNARSLGFAILGILLGAASLAPSSAAQDAGTPVVTPDLPVTVTDATGTDVTVTDISRIVPLNGDIAEIVWALGLGENVVGVDVSATYPPAETGPLPKIGYQRDLSAEGILALAPTVIVGTEDAGPTEVIEQIRTAGVPVVILASSSDLEGIGDKIRGVANALGVVDAGATLAARTDAEIDAVMALATEAESTPRVLFLYVRGAGTQMIGGAGTSADVMITAAGGVNAATEAGIEGFKPITPEALVAAEPDVLLLLSAGLESVDGVDGLLQIPGVAETPAGQNQTVLDYDDLYLLGMGPRTGQALHDLVIGLHPELVAATPEAG